MIDTIKINGTKRLLINNQYNQKLWIVYLDESDIKWINEISDYKQKVKEVICNRYRDDNLRKIVLKELGVD